MALSRKVTRRQFLAISAGTLVSVAASACAGATPVPKAEPTKASAPTQVPAPTQASVPTKTPEPTKAAAPAATAIPTSKYREAPMLTELVKAGKLPPVDQRLPPNPVVVKPTNTVGKYGGTLRGSGMAPETTSDLQITMVAGMFRFSNDLKIATPEVCESYQMSPDSKTCTIKLRQGLKWSDGTPATADDMMFFFEDIQFNKDLSPTLATQWQPGKQPMKVTKVDEYTVKFEFAVPHPAFALLHWSGSPIEALRPKHFLQKYHLKYNPDADKEAKAAGFDDWKARWSKVSIWNYGAMEPDMPVLGPWRPVARDSQRQTYERNPYY